MTGSIDLADALPAAGPPLSGVVAAAVSDASRTTTPGNPVTWGEHVADEQYAATPQT
jgi:hypothetical protein